MSLLRFENVSYIYGANTVFEKKALKDINLDIEKGSFIGLIGHTGSGKSTLLQHMNGLLTPTLGRVFYNEEDIWSSSFEKKKLCGQVGLVFQYPEHQLFEVDVLKDVAFGPKNQGFGVKEAEDRAKEALRMVGMKKSDEAKSPFELSGGEKRRVAIAGVLAMNPEVLVLDEPAAGLDPKSKQDIMEMIAKLHESTGMTVVLSSHSMEDMALYADRLLVMNQGEIVRDGIPSEIFSEHQYLEEIGLSAPEMNYVLEALRQRGYAVRTNVRGVREAADLIAEFWQEKLTKR